MPTDDDTGLDDGDEGSEGVRSLRKRLKEVEAERDGYKSAAERTPALEREIAFARAGLADNPMRRYFEKAYDGEMTTEAIQAAAKEAGLPMLAAGAETAAANERQADVAAHRAIDAVTAGSQQGTQTDDDAYHRALEEAGYDTEKILDVVERFGMHTSRDRQ